MLPIAAEIAVRMTRQEAQSALPQAPVQPIESPAGRHRSRSARAVVVLLHRLATASVRLAERIEQPVRAA
jgi:hypothetical protein